MTMTNPTVREWSISSWNWNKREVVLAAKSNDLNPIEHTWDFQRQRVIMINICHQSLFYTLNYKPNHRFDIFQLRLKKHLDLYK